MGEWTATGDGTGMRVLVYSPVVMFGEGISAFLQTLGSVRAVRVEHDIIGLEAKIAEFATDVALLDVTTPAVLPIARLVKALSPDIATIAMAVAETADDVIACADAGFAAYIPRNASASDLVAILDLTFEGGTLCHPRIARALFNELAKRRPVTPALTRDEEYLTAREVEIVRLLGRGSANKEIAEELHLSVATIKNHVHSVLRKLHVERRSDVARLLVENPDFPSPRAAGVRLARRAPHVAQQRRDTDLTGHRDLSEG